MKQKKKRKKNSAGVPSKADLEIILLCGICETDMGYADAGSILSSMKNTSTQKAVKAIIDCCIMIKSWPKSQTEVLKR